MSKALDLAVVGHTNTGKTSLLRTLTRDPHFGEVRDEPSTTRHVETRVLRVDGEAVVALFDTPGLEAASQLLDYFEQLQVTQGREDGPGQIERFLHGPMARDTFEQEAKVLRQLLSSDAALYVIDAREAVLGKYRDELQLLNYGGRPLLPVLNFVSSTRHRAPEWRQALARLGLHVVVEFDTVAPALDGEQQLYDRLATLLETQSDALQRLRADRQRQRQQRRALASQVIAEALIDVAAVRRSAPVGELEQTSAALRDAVRDRERGAIRELLSLYGFDPDTVAEADLPASAPRLESDLFHPETLKTLGVNLGAGVASGAAAGAAVDLFTGGFSLGAGTVVGATVGGLWQGAGAIGQRVLGRLRGWRDITVDDPILAALMLRLVPLAEALERRGHAAQEPLALAETHGDTMTDPRPDDERTPTGRGARRDRSSADADAWRRGRLPDALRQARGHPEWSRLDANHEDSRVRKAAVQALQALLVRQLE